MPRRIDFFVFGIEVFSVDIYTENAKTSKPALLEKDETNSSCSIPPRHNKGAAILILIAMIVIVEHPQLAALIQHLLL